MQGLYDGSPAVLLPAAAIASVTVSINLVVDWFLSRSDDRVPGEMRR
jgi:hypothetical protein